MGRGAWRAGYSPWVHKEFDTTEGACANTHTHTHTRIYSNASVFFLVENTSVSLIGRRRILWVNGITVFPPVFVL